jgi:Transposase
MRQLAMWFRGILRSHDTAKLNSWLDAADRSGLGPMQRFARMLRRDLEAVRNAVTECWNSGQVEDQINRLKTIKRAMYGRVGIELLRARSLDLCGVVSFAAQYPTPHDGCVRFVAVVTGAHATLAKGRLAAALPRPDFHRPDRASFAWRTTSRPKYN